MKTLLTVVMCSSLFLHAGAGFALATGDSDVARVSRVIDGDSLAVESSGKSYQVRLWGIDSPEWGQSFSGEAKALCRDMVEGRTIEIQEKYRDSYGRVVALVKVDGRVLNEEMISRGMAWVHIRYCDEDICAVWRVREHEARSLGKGLWADRHPTAPWKWKNMQRIRRENSGP